MDNVHIDEGGTRPRITGVPTSTAGFLGITRRGPDAPRVVTSFAEFVRIFGGHLPAGHSTLPFAVEGFFLNGGRQAVIGRVTSRTAGTLTADLDGKARLHAAGPGAWSNGLAVKIESDDAREPQAGAFRLTVVCWESAPPQPLVDPTDPATMDDPGRAEPALVEVHEHLSADPSSPDYYVTRVRAASCLVRVEALREGPPPLMALTLAQTLGTPGHDGAPVDVQDYQGRDLDATPDGAPARSGLAGFETVGDLSIVVVPDHHAVPGLTDALVTHCESTANRIAILHSHPATDTRSSIDRIQPPRDTSYAAFYFPWISVSDPHTGGEALVPPSGHVAGVYARTDLQRGVFKAPANEVVLGVRALQFDVTSRDQEVLNPRGVNCLRSFPGRGVLVWGARSASQNPEWKYVNVRRSLLFLEQSIARGTQWAVFEPNDARLWSSVRSAIEDFLLAQWRGGGLMGRTADEAFFVKVDRTTMTQNDIDNGRLIALVGVAVLTPSEFVIFRIGQWTRDRP